MNKINLFLFLSFLMLTFAANAQQLTVFKTFKDFENKKGEQLGKFLKTKEKIGKLMLVALKEGSTKTETSCNDLWGFKVDEDIYRIYNDGINRIPVRLLNDENMMYYENGVAYLDALKKGKDKGEYRVGGVCFFSKDIGSEVIAIPGLGPRFRKTIKNLKKEYPEYTEIFDCIYLNPDYKDIRSCVINGEPRKKKKGKTRIRLGGNG